MANQFQFGKGVERVVQYARDHGWHIQRTRGGHLRMTRPGLPPVFTSATPSDVRSQRNAIARLRRAQRQGSTGGAYVH